MLMHCGGWDPDGGAAAGTVFSTFHVMISPGLCATSKYRSLLTHYPNSPPLKACLRLCSILSLGAKWKVAELNSGSPLLDMDTIE